MATLPSKDHDLNLKETELCLGLPGGGTEMETPKATTAKRGFFETVDLKLNLQSKEDLNQNFKDVSKENNNTLHKDPAKPPAKSQVVGWPPVRSYRKNMIMSSQKVNSENGTEKTTNSTTTSGAFVKVSMDGAPYLRKVDLKMYKCYQELCDALVKMFSSFTMEGNYGAQGMINFINESKLVDLLNSSEFVPTYEDKDGDWMLVGDVPWEMFVESCKRLRIMKGSDAIGLAPRAMEKCKSRS